jgi:hypothetical protein
MKTSLLTILLVIAALQRLPQTPEAPLDAAQCKCSIEVTMEATKISAARLRSAMDRSRLSI